MYHKICKFYYQLGVYEINKATPVCLHRWYPRTAPNRSRPNCSPRTGIYLNNQVDYKLS